MKLGCKYKYGFKETCQKSNKGLAFELRGEISPGLCCIIDFKAGKMLVVIQVLLSILPRCNSSLLHSAVY